MVYETIGNYDRHSVCLVLRGRTGSAEFHETESDLYIAKRGRATFVIDGELVESRERRRRQRSGTAIRSGNAIRVRIASECRERARWGDSRQT